MHWARKIVGRLIDNAQYYTRRVWYPIRCWLRPYNVVRIKTLPRGWTDRTEILLHASFQVLVDFVEKEESIDQSSDPDTTEATFLYNWWTVERPRRLDISESVPLFVETSTFVKCIDGNRVMYTMEDVGGSEADAARELMAESLRHDDEWSAEDDAMLKRLIDIRGYLWT